jgi:hypothetical protein
MRIVRLVIGLLLGLLLVAGLYAAGALLGFYGEDRGPGAPSATRVPETVVSQRARAQRAAAQQLAVAAPKQILFGDLHVHTTYSTDAFLWSLPIMSGEGAHPLGEACDFARFCSGLDFWSINDHAEASSPRKWRDTKEAIRQCNQVGGEGSAPDVIAFLGWEWTQIGATAEQHWGHKNVVLKETAEEIVPTRPIHSGGVTRTLMAENPAWIRLLPVLADFGNRQQYYDFDAFIREIAGTPECERGVDVRELPEDCAEGAETPGELFEKLAQWDQPSLVIPHGTTWGIYTPPAASWDKQLRAAQHDPSRQTLIEVFSGHGNSEEYRDFRPVIADGERVTCPPPSKNYLPSCWRAGELIRQRCEEAGEDAAECDRRAAEARQHYADAGLQGRLSVPGETAMDWLDSGQCRDCFQPAFNYRPQGAAQYIAALRNFEEPQGPERFRFGFIASSDVHTGRPGTGYKEFARTSMADQSGPVDQGVYDALYPRGEPEPESRAVAYELSSGFAAMRASEVERQNSFWLTGGLVAVHAESRTRDGVWDALSRKETYGTSGERILLWFDLLNPPGRSGRVPMGGEVEMRTTPVFEVRAVGAFEQQPGCPDYSLSALSPEKIERLCRGECYHPSDRRRKIDRIEIVRIRPQQSPDEPFGRIIEDPWRSFECADDESGCTAAFVDPDHASGARDAVYYARAIQEPTLAVNADNLRCEYDENGECVRMRPCWGDFRTPASDECLSETQERAWSSPIYVDWPRDAIARSR